MDAIGLITTFLLVCLVFVPLERLYPLNREQKIFRPGWQVDIGHVLFTGLSIQLCHAVIIVSAVASLRQLVPHGFQAALQDQPLWLQYLEILIIADLGFYAMHRAFHAVGQLWRLHAVHHSSERLDFLAAHRVHPIDQFMVRSVTLIPVFALGFDATALLLFAVIYHWHGMLLHSNTRFRFRWIERIVATPAFHHWHHANLGSKGQNFAGQLALIDRLFGTYYLPDRAMPREYGIDDAVPGNYLGQLIAPFRERVPKRRVPAQLPTR